MNLPKTPGAPQRDTHADHDLRADVEQRLLHFVDRAVAGSRRVAVVRGPRGSGRSTLLRAVAAAARQQEFVVASIEGFSSTVDRTASSRLASELPVDGMAVLADPRRALRFELDRLAAVGRRVLLLVDDLERLGAEDLALIQELALHPPEGPTALLLSADGEARRSGALVARLLDQVLALPYAESFDLEPLTREELRGLLRTRAILEAATGTFVEDLHDLTGGNLRYAVAWLDMLCAWPHAERLRVLSGSQPLDAVPPPSGLADLMGAEVAELPADAVGLIRALAIWSRPALTRDLTQLSGRSTAEVELTLEDITERGIVEVAETAGGLSAWLPDRTLAHVVRHGMPLPASRRLHRAAANMIAPPAGAQGADAVAAADHYVASGEPLDTARMSVLVDAARWLNGISRYAKTYQLLSGIVGAQEVGPGGMGAASTVPKEAYSLLAEAMARFGAWRDARELVEAVGLLSRSGDDRAALLTRAARDHVSRGSDETAMRLYRMLLDDPDLTPAMRLRVAEDAGRVIDVLGHHQEARDLARTAAIDAEKIGDLALAADIWISYHSLLIYAGELYESLEVAIHALRLARRARSPRPVGRAVIAVGNCLADTGPLGRAIRWLRRGMQIAQSAGDSASVAWVSVRLAQAYEDTGDWESARAAGRNAVHTDLALHRIRAANRSRATLSILETRRGNLAEGSLLMDLVQGRDEEGIDDVRGVSLALAGYEHAVASGDWGLALSQARLARRRMQKSETRRRTLLVEVIPREALAGAMLQDAEAVESAAADFEAIQHELPGPATPLFDALSCSVRADLAAVRGDLDAAALEAAAAAEAYGALGYRWRRANALLHRGEFLAQLDTDAKDEAAASLSEAFLEFRAIGAAPQVEVTRAALRAIGRRAPRMSQSRQGALTRREWQILRHAATGKRDVEIAGELWISPRTVSTHMHNLLKKAGLRSRHELAAWLAQQDSAAGGRWSK